MSSPKPLPPLPDRRRQVKIVTPPPLSSLAPSSTAVRSVWKRDRKPTEVRGRGLPPSPYPEYLLPPEDGDNQSGAEEGALRHEEGSDDDASDEDFKLLKAKFLPPVSYKDKVARLKDEVAALQQENATLRKQLSATGVPRSRDQDRAITRLREENEQLQRASREQDRQVSHIAQTIAAAFREYQEARGLPSPRSDRSWDTPSQKNKPDDDSVVIHVHKEISSFDTDSESDY